MKRFLANLAIVLGVVVAACGLIGTPIIQDLLPVDFMLPVDDQAAHRYFRVVPTTAQSADYLPYALLAAGLVFLMIGVFSRRRLRGIAA